MIENQRKSSTSPYPVENWRSWIVLLCAFLTNVLILGTLISFGIFYPALLTEFKQDKAVTALLDSLNLIVGGVVAPLSGRLTDRFGCRATSVAAFLTSALSFLTTSYIPSFYFMFVTYSIPFGCVVSSIYSSTVLAVVSHFEKKRSMALGIISAAAGAGQFTMSPVIQVLLDNFGLRKTYRILALIMAVCSLVGYMVNARSSDEIGKKQEKLKYEDEEDAKSLISRLRTILRYAFVNGDLIIITISNAIVAGMGLLIPQLHLAKYAEGLGIPTNKVAQLYLVNGALSMIGRILSGFVLDKRCITPIWFFAFNSLIGGVATLLLPLVTAYWYLMVINSVLGWVKGALISTTYVIQLQIIADFVPKSRQAQTFGVCNFLYFCISSAGPSTAGFLADKFGSYAAAFYMAGGVELFGFVLVCLSLCINLLTNRNTDNTNTYKANDAEYFIVIDKVSVL